MGKSRVFACIAVLALLVPFASAGWLDTAKSFIGLGEYSGYECYVSVKSSMITSPDCIEHKNRGHLCQITGEYEGGIPKHCSTFCLKRSKIPNDCANVSVRASSLTEDQFKEFHGINDSTDTQPDCEFDQKWNGKECIPDVELLPNQFEILYSTDGTKIIKFADAFGQEKYTRDGEHYYDSYSDVSTSNPFRTSWEFVKDAPGDLLNFLLFKTSLPDKEKELQREIGIEVLNEFSVNEVEKIKDSYAKQITNLAQNVLPKYAKDLLAAPAESIQKFAQVAKETEFAEGVMIYIAQRESGTSSNSLYQNTPEELIYGGIGGGVAVGLQADFPKALLFAKYEESYQRYRIANALGRTS